MKPVRRPRGSWARQDLHEARMVEGLGLCGECLGWVDDPRHTKIGQPVRGVSFVLRTWKKIGSKND